MAFHITLERPSGELDPILIRLSGQMTLGPHLLDFHRRTSELLTSRHPRGIFLDMSAVTDIDSAGLGELVILYTTLGSQSCRLCLIRPSPRIVRLLETTKLSDILPQCDGIAAAKAWLSD